MEQFDIGHSDSSISDEIDVQFIPAFSGSSTVEPTSSLSMSEELSSESASSGTCKYIQQSDPARQTLCQAHMSVIPPFQPDLSVEHSFTGGENSSRTTEIRRRVETESDERLAIDIEHRGLEIPVVAMEDSKSNVVTRSVALAIPKFKGKQEYVEELARDGSIEEDLRQFCKTYRRFARNSNIRRFFETINIPFHLNRLICEIRFQVKLQEYREGYRFYYFDTEDDHVIP